MSKVLKFVKKNGQFVLAGVSTALFSVASMAGDQTAAITTAQTEGTANVTAVIGAVLAIAILGFGVNALLNWFKK